MIEKFLPNSHVDDLRENGYTLLRGVLDEVSCLHYVKLLEKSYEAYSSKYAGVDLGSSLADKSFEKVVYNLHNKSLDWYKLFEDSMVNSVVGPILREGSYENNEPYYLYNNSARNPLKGNDGQQLHVDSNLPGVNYPIIINAMWYFEDADEENGATIVVPGTHNRCEYAENGKIYSNQVSLTVNRGDVLIFNGNIWHGGGANKSGESRWALVLGYARWFIKPSFDYTRNTPLNIFSALTDNQRRLLGFDLLPPKDEFTRVRRRNDSPESPSDYHLP